MQSQRDWDMFLPSPTPRRMKEMEMSKLAHSNDETMHQIERDRTEEDGLDPDRCQSCGALTNDDGYSVELRCCFYCKSADWKTERTPGPWFVGDRSPETLEIAIVYRHHDGRTYCPAVAIPCGAGSLATDHLPEMTEANARLIAAAPELLAVCEDIVSLHAGEPDEDVLPYVVAARAAIAKARGEGGET